MRIVAADVDEAGLAQTIDGLDGVAVRTDVSERREVLALADRAWAAYGAVHVVCNNAGVALWGGLEAATHRDWRWVLGVNLWGVIHGVEAFVPRMIAQQSEGHVVNTASMAGLIASQGLGVYNTSKYAVVGLSETLVKDLRPYGIGVSVLCPMGVATRIRDSERGRPRAAAPGRMNQAAAPGARRRLTHRATRPLTGRNRRRTKGTHAAPAAAARASSAWSRGPAPGPQACTAAQVTPKPPTASAARSQRASRLQRTTRAGSVRSGVVIPAGRGCAGGRSALGAAAARCTSRERRASRPAHDRRPRCGGRARLRRAEPQSPRSRSACPRSRSD